MELVYDEPSQLVIKALVCAKLLGFRMGLRQAAATPTCLKNGSNFKIAGQGILKYMCVSRAGVAGLYPCPPYNKQSNLKAAQIDAWIDFGRAVVDDHLSQFRAGEQVRGQLQKALGGLERHLSRRTYLVGQQLTLADVSLACDMEQAYREVLDSEAQAALPATSRWLHTCRTSFGPFTMDAAVGVEPPNSSAVQSSAAPRSINLPETDGGAEKAPKNSKKPPKDGKKVGKDGKNAASNSKSAAGKDVKKETKLGLSVSKYDDFGAWYSELVVKSNLIGYYAISGCYILWEDSFAMWERVTAFFDERIKSIGVRNVYFPLFVTEDVLTAEKDHVEGFAPEVAWVTKSGQSELEKPIAIRPTSETVMYPYYATRIRSWRDLPLRLNQWTNVVRWEFKHPTPFIRSREFLWQEGHTAFATKKEAAEEVMQILEFYRQVYEDLLAVPVETGYKSSTEKFAGALYTTSVEAFIPTNGRGVQGATSHCLGQNFSKMFNILYETELKSHEYAWQNSWGLSTRSLGVLIMTHSDDRGLVLPPRVAPTQVVAIPIPKGSLSPEEKAQLNGKVDEFAAQLTAAGIRVQTDKRDNYTPGWKFNHWEMKGIPLRLEMGPMDLEKGTVVVVRRDLSGSSAKEFVAWGDVTKRVGEKLEEMQKEMFDKAKKEFVERKRTVLTRDEFMQALDDKCMALAPWCDEEDVEAQIKKWSASGDAMGAKTLNLPLNQPTDPPISTLKCFFTGKPAKNWALFARSY